ncbi:MAG TPA: hypothetical protein VJP07_05665 [Dehalococcoidia bacterium]|nr:hypothetical protein [Dehalococcoidia bacterium]
MVAKNSKLTTEKRKALHAKLALDPSLPEKIDRALADYEEALAKGELRRTTTRRSNGRARKGAS